MSNFDLSLSPLMEVVEGEKVASGVIVIGSFCESFRASLSYWTRDQYLSHWEHAARGLVNGARKAAFITSMYNPKNANFIRWWVFHATNEDIKIQNQMLFLDSLDIPFDENNCERHIGERAITAEDGSMISEWNCQRLDIQNFWDRLSSNRCS